MAVVVFNAKAFQDQYPEFSGFTTGQLQASFNTATLLCNNTDQAIITDPVERQILLWLLTAHITKLMLGTNDGTTTTPPPSGVGRVEIAKEGSVHVRLDMGVPAQGSVYYLQTQYGAAFWTLTAKYRTMRYFPARNPYCALGRNLMGRR